MQVEKGWGSTQAKRGRKMETQCFRFEVFELNGGKVPNKSVKISSVLIG